MTAHRSTDAAAPSLIHGCRAPPHPTPAGAIAPGSAGTPHRGQLRGFPLPHNLSSIPRTRTLPRGHGGLETLEECLQSRELQHLLPHGYLSIQARYTTLLHPQEARPDTCPDPRLRCGTTSEPASNPSSPAVLRFARQSPSPSSWPRRVETRGSFRHSISPSPVVNATPGRRRGPWLNAKILRAHQHFPSIRDEP